MVIQNGTSGLHNGSLSVEFLGAILSFTQLVSRYQFQCSLLFLAASLFYTLFYDLLVWLGNFRGLAV
jgi:hypothetical protein